MLQLEVFVGELFTVDRFASGASAVGEVTALQHELWDDPVELGALEMEWFSTLNIAQEVKLLKILGLMKPVLNNKFNLFHLTTLCHKDRLEIGKYQNSRKLILFS